MRRALASLLLLAAPLPALAADVCYRLPFNNPNLRDGWGSTCCGRTNPHRGLDFPQASGTNIPAVADGVVRVRASSSCLGNVVVLEHADGMFSGYAHMLSGSPLAEGTRVAKGQTIGRVGSTGSCTTGPHLHLTMSRSVGGWGSGTTIDPHPYITSRTTCARAPRGYLDSATCDGITGWAQDQDTASAAIDVHLYVGGPAGAAGVDSFAVRADVSRPDLCSAIGSCAHGFSARVPLAYFDGVERPVYAYGIDSAGGANTLLTHSPRTLRCDQAPLPDLPTGRVRRHVPSPSAMAAWKLARADIAPLDDATLGAVDDGPALPAAPALVRIEGADAVYLREGDVLRHVPSPAAMAAWRFDYAAIQVVSAAALGDVLHGAPWPEAPFLAQGTAAEVYAIDAPPPLWAARVSDDVPAQMTAGTTADVTLRLDNRGSLAWTEAVALVTDAPSPWCDEATWPSCTRAAQVSGEVVPGAEGALTVRLRAPDVAGPTALCFALVHGAHAFGDPHQGGPATGALCWEIEVVPVGQPLDPGTDPEPGAPIEPGAPLTPGDPATDEVSDDPQAAIGGSCAATGPADGALVLVLGLMMALAVLRRGR